MSSDTNSADNTSSKKRKTQKEKNKESGDVFEYLWEQRKKLPVSWNVVIQIYKRINGILVSSFSTIANHEEKENIE